MVRALKEIRAGVRNFLNESELKKWRAGRFTFGAQLNAFDHDTVEFPYPHASYSIELIRRIKEPIQLPVDIFWSFDNLFPLLDAAVNSAKRAGNPMPQGTLTQLMKVAIELKTMCGNRTQLPRIGKLVDAFIFMTRHAGEYDRAQQEEGIVGLLEIVARMKALVRQKGTDFGLEEDEKALDVPREQRAECVDVVLKIEEAIAMAIKSREQKTHPPTESEAKELVELFGKLDAKFAATSKKYCVLRFGREISFETIRNLKQHRHSGSGGSRHLVTYNPLERFRELKDWIDNIKKAMSRDLREQLNARQK